jgi:hypothetical protein
VGSEITAVHRNTSLSRVLPAASLHSAGLLEATSASLENGRVGRKYCIQRKNGHGKSKLVAHVTGSTPCTMSEKFTSAEANRGMHASRDGAVTTCAKNGWNTPLFPRNTHRAYR